MRFHGRFLSWVAMFLSGWLTCAPPTLAQSEANPDRILAIVRTPPADGNGYAVLDVSQDRQTLFFIGTRGLRRTPSGETVGTDARLLVYDVRDVRRPSIISELPLGDMTPTELAARSGRLFLLYKGEGVGRQDGLMIFDVADSEHPQLLGQIDIDGFWLELTADGQFGALSYWKDHEIRRMGLDLRDPMHASLSDPPAHANDLESVTWRTAKLGIPGIDSPVFDRIGDRVLTERHRKLLIWDVSDASRPQVAREIGAGLRPLSARMLPEQDAIVAEAIGRLVFISTMAREVSSDALQRVLDRQQADYEARRKGLEPDWSLPERLIAQFEDAGAASLLASDAAGLSPDERIQLLNAYGFWLGQSVESERAVPVLRKAVELAPDRADVQLNLAEAARKSLGRVVPYEEKQDLSRTVVAAYAAYRRLSDEDAPGAADFAALNIADASFSDVCAYVAAFYNRGRQGEIFADAGPIDISNDGLIDELRITSQGSAHVPIIEPEESDINFFYPKQLWSYHQIHFVPFKTKAYVLYQIDDGPQSVVEANVGPVCSFDWHFKAALVESHDPNLCADAVRGTEFSRVPTTSEELPTIPLDTFRIPSEQTRFLSAATIDIGDELVRVGYFEITSSAGPGCQFSGVTFLDGNDIERSPRNRTLLEAQDRLRDCRGSTAFLIQVADEALVEVDGGSAYQRETPPRTLLRVQGGKVEPLCRVEQNAMYVAKVPSHQ